MSPQRLGITVMAVGLLKTATDSVISGLQGGRILATAELAETRLGICQKCEFLMKTSRCAKCGCFVAAKVKAEMSKCPVGNW